MKKIEKKQYIKFAIAAVLYGLFILWMQNGWLALGYILLADIYLTKYIPWDAWKKTNNPTLKSIYDWIDDIIFALVAVYFINLFIFQIFDTIVQTGSQFFQRHLRNHPDIILLCRKFFIFF